jgi:hypothetical protein
MHMWWDELITKHLTLDSHMNGNMFTWYLKECLLGGRETFACVGNLVKKFTIADKMKQLSFQKMELKSGQPGVTRFGYSIMSSKTRKCQSQHVVLHPEK